MLFVLCLFVTSCESKDINRTGWKIANIPKVGHIQIKDEWNIEEDDKYLLIKEDDEIVFLGIPESMQMWYYADKKNKTEPYAKWQCNYNGTEILYYDDTIEEKYVNEVYCLAPGQAWLFIQKTNINNEPVITYKLVPKNISYNFICLDISKINWSEMVYMQHSMTSE